MFFWKRTSDNTSSNKSASDPQYQHKFVEDDFVHLIETNDPLQKSSFIINEKTVSLQVSTTSKSEEDKNPNEISNINPSQQTLKTDIEVNECKSSSPTSLPSQTMSGSLETSSVLRVSSNGIPNSISLTTERQSPSISPSNPTSHPLMNSLHISTNLQTESHIKINYKLILASFIGFLAFLSIILRSSKILHMFETIFWTAVLCSILVSGPFLITKLKFGSKISMFISFGLGYLLKWWGFSYWWIIAFGGLLVLFALLEEYQKKEPSSAPVRSSREWMNTIAKTFLTFITNFVVEEFDIGDTLPSFHEISLNKKPQNGFEMTVAYNYCANENTKLKLWVPIPIPGYGTTNIPIAISGPQISGKVHLECRIEKCSITYFTQENEKVSTHEDFLALAVAFDPVDNIHIGAIKVLMAPKWEWLQKIETVKREMRQLVSSLMTTDSVVIHVFDQKFNYIGSVTRKRSKNSENVQSGNSSDWTLQEVISEVRTCYKCKRKYFADNAGCCACIVDVTLPSQSIQICHEISDTKEQETEIRNQ